MTKEQAQFLVKVTEDCGNQEIDLRENYSGRGMYGTKTCGVVVSSWTILMSDCINYLSSPHANNSDVPDFRGFSTDNMGRNIILY